MNVEPAAPVQAAKHFPVAFPPAAESGLPESQDGAPEEPPLSHEAEPISLKGIGKPDHSSQLVSMIGSLAEAFKSEGTTWSKMRVVNDLLSRFAPYSLRLGPTMIMPKLRAISLTRYYALRDGNFILQLNAQGIGNGWRQFIAVAKLLATSRDSILPEDIGFEYGGPGIYAVMEDRPVRPAEADAHF